MSINAKKASLIHVAKRNLGLSDEAYRDILIQVAGVSTATDLDDASFSAVMNHLSELGFQSKARAREFGSRRNMASPRQVAYIRSLWSQYTDGVGTDASLGKWLRAKFRVDALRFVDADQAPRVITALRRMVAAKDGAPTG